MFPLPQAAVNFYTPYEVKVKIDQIGIMRAKKFPSYVSIGIKKVLNADKEIVLRIILGALRYTTSEITPAHPSICDQLTPHTHKGMLYCLTSKKC